MRSSQGSKKSQEEVAGKFPCVPPEIRETKEEVSPSALLLSEVVIFPPHDYLRQLGELIRKGAISWIKGTDAGKLDL
jgi:hypothetical protein